jgi:hypothetical protein
MNHIQELGGGRIGIYGGGGLFGGGSSSTSSSKLPAHQDTALFSTKPEGGNLAANLATLRTSDPDQFRERCRLARQDGAEKLTAKFSKIP